MNWQMDLRVYRHYVATLTWLLIMLCLSISIARADSSPPKSVADIAAVIEHEKLDPKRREKVDSLLKAEPPANASPSKTMEFYIEKAAAYSSVGRFGDAVKLLEQAVEFGRAKGVNVQDALGSMVVAARSDGQLKKALETDLSRESDLKSLPNPARLLGSYRQTVMISLALGEIKFAEEVIKKMELTLRSAASTTKDARLYMSNWEGHSADARARMFEARGMYREAELSYLKASEKYEDSRKMSSRWPTAPTQDGFYTSKDGALSSAAMNMARQGRLKEAEIDARRALMSELQYFGKYGGVSVFSIGVLGQIVMMQGRYADAERLFRNQIAILDDLRFAPGNQVVVGAQRLVAQAVSLQERWQEASDIYDSIAASMASSPDWSDERAARFLTTPNRTLVLYNTGRIDEGVALAQKLMDQTRTRFADDHYDTAMTRGLLAAGYVLAKRTSEALPLFQQSIPILTARLQADDSSGTAAQQALQVRRIVEAYIAMLGSYQGGLPADVDPATESLKLVDFVRGQSVQRALSASSARAAVRDPELAKLVREEQDDERRVGAIFQSINDALALPPDQRDNGAIKQLQTDVGKLRDKRNAAWKTIERKFPAYAGLINPQAPSVEDIRKALKPGEAFLSVYFASKYSFVWVVPKSGDIAFASTPVGAKEIEQKVNRLREALEPKAETLDGVPPFDLATAHELYSLILKPVEAAWKPAKSLILVTNGALGLLPLGLLPTEPIAVRAGVGQPLFAEYRGVPWLARTHAVTMVPSASAFTTLRALPPSSRKREPMIGFGDPLFSREQATEAQNGPQLAQAASATRGVPLQRRNAPKTSGVSGAELALLPRLPDTSDELRSIALALQADPTKVLNLGKDANTRKVKTADLAGYKIVAFATHGLVPGELEGLTQPALALSAPDVADTDGDGLLTMEEILGLKLDADWVVLSACNTGAGSGAGAEAASGLGRAFFYAGSRALLVTNWSVHSASARELVTDLFRRQTQDPKLTRSEALQQASMALLDSPGYQEGGKTVFSYGHPIFWAPYSIIGDGGGGV